MNRRGAEAQSLRHGGLSRKWSCAGNDVSSAPLRHCGSFLLCAAILLCGCGAIDPESVPPLRTELAFGSAGRSLGQFNVPRSIAIDHEREFIYIVDRSARIQRYGFDGKPQLLWRMPDYDMGFPVGLSVCPQGRLLVADTHYYRVIIYDQDGNELRRFGEFGTEPGQFIYTTRVLATPDGRYYVAETGGNDRVQVFDAEFNYLFEFGSFGSAQGQFNRPQSMAFNHDYTELFVVDACNHRIQVFSPEGKFLRQIGGPGRGLGQLAYPYDVVPLSDGSIVVCEYHNARLQKFSPRGEARGLYGRLGRGDGEMQHPWGMAGNDRNIFVLDSGNNRVQKVRTP